MIPTPTFERHAWWLVQNGRVRRVIRAEGTGAGTRGEEIRRILDRDGSKIKEEAELLRKPDNQGAVDSSSSQNACHPEACAFCRRRTCVPAGSIDAGCEYTGPSR